jgi:hypothetical protein
MHFNRSTAPAHTGGETAGRHCTARLNGSTLSEICARPTTRQQRVLARRRQPWRTRRRRHRARAATSMVDSAPRARTSRHCPTSALVPPHDNSKYRYIVGNLGAHGGGATVHGRRHRWSTVHRAPTQSTLSDICARSAIPPQRALVHHRQPWRTRRRRHSRTGGEIDGRECTTRLDESTLSDICARPARQQ